MTEIDIQKHTILLVDDNNSSLILLENLLEKDNRFFHRAVTAKEALKIALNTPLDLIILDVNLPDMSGFEIAEILKSNPQTEHVPLIFITAVYKKHEHILKGVSKGAVDYFFKPIESDIVRAKVKSFLDLKRRPDHSSSTSKETDETDHIFVKSSSQYIKVKFKDILYVQAEGDYVIIKTTTAKHIVHTTMKKIESKLSADFVRVHRSYIINRINIDSFHDYVIKVSEHAIPVGNSYYTEVLNTLNKL